VIRHGTVIDGSFLAGTIDCGAISGLQPA